MKKTNIELIEQSENGTMGIVYKTVTDRSYAAVEEYIGTELQVVIPGKFENIPVTVISELAFEDKEIVSVDIPESVTSIGGLAFSNCSRLKSITIPNGVSIIGDNAFLECTALESVFISESVTRIGEGLLMGCSNLKNIFVDKNNPVYHSMGDCLIESESKTLIFGASSCVIPSDGSVTKIGAYSFWCNENLTHLVIPEDVISIECDAFSGCLKLESVVIPATVTSIGDYAFKGCSSLGKVYYTGSEEDWAKISIGSYNDHLKKANIVCNYIPEK